MLSAAVVRPEHLPAREGPSDGAGAARRNENEAKSAKEFGATAPILE